MSDEDEYKKALAESGVDLPELKESPKDEPKEPVPEAPKDEPKGEPEDDKATVPLHKEPKEPPRKRSIYDDYKEKKLEAKTATERAEIAERERDELQKKLDDVSKAGTPEEKKEALDEVEAFAKEIDASPETVRKLISLAQKGVKAEIDPETKKELEEFRKWKADNSEAIEQSYFEKDYTSVTPKLKEMFPQASELNDEFKKELDTISHTKEWHDKPLTFVAFMNKDKLEPLLSPRKRGMEDKGRKESGDVEVEFDINADLSKMNPKQRDEWEAEYNKLGKSDGLMTDSQGRKSIL